MGIYVGDPMVEELAGNVYGKRSIIMKVHSKGTDQLGTFFSQVHSGEQIGEACFDGQGKVKVGGRCHENLLIEHMTRYVNLITANGDCIS
jgi:hypothetical protein